VYNTTSCNTQSSAPADRQDYRPKHFELIEIINKPLLLHLVGVYIIYINDVGQTNIKFVLHFHHYNLYWLYRPNITWYLT